MAEVDRGYLLIADIGGYTAYLAAVELEHAHDVLADLIGVIAATLGASFTVDKLEGDAVFAHRSGDLSADQLVELLQAAYFGFRRRQRDIDHSTSCACRACASIPELELKFVVHHGEIVERKMARSRELVGTDVILVHRLLKNSVTEQTGILGYALLTQTCVDHVDLDSVAVGLVEHHQVTTDDDRVSGWLLDLEGKCERIRTAPRSTSSLVRRAMCSISTYPRRRQLRGNGSTPPSANANGKSAPTALTCDTLTGCGGLAPRATASTARPRSTTRCSTPSPSHTSRCDRRSRSGGPCSPGSSRQPPKRR